MRVTLDTDNKTIIVHEANFGELIKFFENTLDLDDYQIISYPNTYPNMPEIYWYVNNEEINVEA